MYMENINPDFAEKLMSTLYAGGNLNDEDYEKCKQIWNECDNERSKVLNKVVEYCGNINSSQTRYLKAIAYSFNTVNYSKERISAINNYLNKKLYGNAYNNLSITIEKGINYGKKVHTAIMIEYLSQAYQHIKDYENEEKCYKKIIELKISVPNGYILLANFYRKRKNIDDGINLLKKAKHTLLYLNDKDFKLQINKKINIFEKMKKGIKNHLFSCYETYPSAFINGVYYKEYELKQTNLIKEYRNVFEYHRELLSNIDMLDFEKNDEFNQNYVTYCLTDISLYQKICEFYDKFNKIGFDNTYEYCDNYNMEYVTFKKLIKYYEKFNMYNYAISLCDLCINKYNIVKFTDRITMVDKQQILIEKIQK